MNQKKTTMIALLFALVLILAGCSEAATEDTAALTTKPVEVEQQEAIAGTLFLKVNPEIAVSYDSHGNVMNITSKNDDAKEILEGYTGFEGKPSKDVVSELVKRIADKGYFVEEIEGEAKNIVLEVERGSKLPDGVFLDDVVKAIQTFIDSQDWTTPVKLNSTDYDVTDFDARTDYDATDYTTDDTVTDYMTDYNDLTDYGKTVIPVKPTTPAKDVKPAPAPAPAPAPSDSPYTDYDDTDYSDSPYTDYSAPAPAPAPAPSDSDYSDYDDDSDYSDDDDSGYSDYDDSDYDD